MKSKTKRKLSDFIEVELLKPHTHAGRHYAIGDKLQLRPNQALRLIEGGIARKITAEKERQ